MDFFVKFWIGLVFAMAGVPVGAEEPKSALNLEYDLTTQESILQSNGIYYRKVEYKNEVFYLRLQEPDVDHGAKDFSCSEGKAPMDMQNMIFVSTRVSRRSSVFLEGLRKTCGTSEAGTPKSNLDPNLRIGFVFDDAEKSVLKNKRLYLTPGLIGIGFGADW